MLAWKEKVADRLARLLADSPVSPSPTQAAVAPSQSQVRSASLFRTSRAARISIVWVSVDSVVGTGGLGSRRKVGGILEMSRGVEFRSFMAKGSIFLPPRVAWFRVTELGTCCLGDWFLVQLAFVDLDLELGFLDGFETLEWRPGIS